MMSDIDVTLAPLTDKGRLISDWRSLEKRSDRAFFLSSTWINSWLDVLTRRPMVLEARRGGDLVGLALMCQEKKHRHRLLPVTSLSLHETGVRDEDIVWMEYNDILADSSCADDVRRAGLGALAGNRLRTAGWDELCLTNVTDPMARAAADAGLTVRTREELPTFGVNLDAIRASGRDYLGSLRSNTRSQLRRSLSLYEAMGRLRLRHASGPDEAQVFFAAMAELSRKRWDSRAERSAMDYPFFVRFHEALMSRGLPLGEIDVVQITAGDHTLGYLYSFVDRGIVYSYQSGFVREADNRLKPGMVSHFLYIQHHLSIGSQYYDFMAGSDRYKASLGDAGAVLRSIVLQRPRLKLKAENAVRRCRQAAARALSAWPA